MKIEDLKRKKIYLSSVDNRREFQERIFSLGVKWKDGSRDIKELDKCFFYIDVDFRLSMGSDVDFEVNHFREHEYEQIFFHDVMAIGKPKEKYRFKPYDKVIVRAFGDDSTWVASFYSHYSEDWPFPYVTVSGRHWLNCVPFKGNEHLVGTADSPD